MATKIETIELFRREKIKAYADRPKNIASILDKALIDVKDKLAVVTEDKEITYAELDEFANRAGAFLQKECGVQQGDRIATIIGNRFHFPILVMACAKIGAIMVPINVKLSPPEITYILEHSDINVLLYEMNYEEMIKEIKREHIHVIPEHTYDVDNDQTFSTIFQYDGELKSVIVDEADGAYLLYTSGTTGRPKGALLTHINVIHGVMSFQKIFQTHRELKTLIAVPICHVTGLIGQLLHLLYVGGTVYTMEKYQNKKYIETVLENKITFLFNVPTMFIMMSTEPSFLDNNFDFVEKVAYGGSPIYQHTFQLIRKKFPNADLYHSYGSTETSSPATLLHIKDDESKVKSVGLPVPVADIKIVDDDGKECAVYETGEIYIKGPMVIKEYWRNPKANEEDFTEGYWHSGDIGYKDEDGFIYVKDRKKDMINRGGEKIFSIEVEDVLKSHPLIKEVAVVGVPDEVFGEKVKAVIVAPDITDLNIEDIKQYCREKLAKFKVPEIFDVVDTLPRNASGKILKHVLR